MSDGVEYAARIWGDSDDYLEVRPDRDGLDLIEISYTDGDTEKVIIIDEEMGEQLASALMTVISLNTTQVEPEE